jgi:hypothetical protein
LPGWIEEDTKGVMVPVLHLDLELHFCFLLIFTVNPTFDPEPRLFIALFFTGMLQSSVTKVPATL